MKHFSRADPGAMHLPLTQVYYLAVKSKRANVIRCLSVCQRFFLLCHFMRPKSLKRFLSTNNQEGTSGCSTLSSSFGHGQLTCNHLIHETHCFCYVPMGDPGFQMWGTTLGGDLQKKEKKILNLKKKKKITEGYF